MKSIRFCHFSCPLSPFQTKNPRKLPRAGCKTDQYYRSSRKYAMPRLCGGWSSRFFRIAPRISTNSVARYGSILKIS